MNRKKKIKLRVQPMYTVIMCIILVLTFCIFLIFPSFVWEIKHDIWEILYYSILLICLAACLFFFLHYIQFAVLDEKGIMIKGLFYTIAKVKWGEIYKIEAKSLVTHESRGPPVISYKWLIIHMQKKEPEIKRGGINKRNKPPWQIIATKKNKELIQKYHSIIQSVHD